MKTSPRLYTINPYERKDLMIVNMGPHHSSMHGVLRLILTLDGEDVIDSTLINKETGESIH